MASVGARQHGLLRHCGSHTRVDIWVFVLAETERRLRHEQKLLLRRISETSQGDSVGLD